MTDSSMTPSDVFKNASSDSEYFRGPLVNVTQVQLYNIDFQRKNLEFYYKLAFRELDIENPNVPSRKTFDRRPD